MSVQVLWMEAPVAEQTRVRSAEETRPAQKMSRSAKYLGEDGLVVRLCAKRVGWD